jgi:c-di-GMP-binding flagellar brake protein YcgR
MAVHQRIEKRASIRFSKVFEVFISSEQFGEFAAIARNISEGGMLIETVSPFPLGSECRVRFQIPDSEASLIARAEVKNHYCFNYAHRGCLRCARGMGVKFLEFLEDQSEHFRVSLSRMRTLH